MNSRVNLQFYGGKATLLRKCEKLKIITHIERLHHQQRYQHGNPSEGMQCECCGMPVSHNHVTADNFPLARTLCLLTQPLKINLNKTQQLIRTF